MTASKLLLLCPKSKARFLEETAGDFGWSVSPVTGGFEFWSTFGETSSVFLGVFLGVVLFSDDWLGLELEVFLRRSSIWMDLGLAFEEIFEQMTGVDKC